MSLPKRNLFDNASLSTYTLCPRKYRFRYLQGYTPKQEHKALSFGKAIHKAMDAFYTGKPVEEAVQAFKDNYEEHEDDTLRTLELGEWIIRNYYRNYQDQPMECVANELPFEVPFDDTWSFIGRIDRIVQYNNVLWVMDHKTMSGMRRDYHYSLYPNPQLIGYVWAARKLGYNVSGIIIDAILVAKGLLKASSRERLMPLARYDLYTNEYMLRDWEDYTRNWLGKVKTSITKNEFIPNYNACTHYSRCAYHAICSETPEMWDKILQAEYTINHWDPHEEYGDQVVTPQTKEVRHGGRDTTETTQGLDTDTT